MNCIRRQAKIEQFRENIERVQALGGLHQAFGTVTTAAIDLTDLLRAQIVMLVSALDHYTLLLYHNLVLLNFGQFMSIERCIFQYFFIFLRVSCADLTGKNTISSNIHTLIHSTPLECKSRDPSFSIDILLRWSKAAA